MMHCLISPHTQKALRHDDTIVVFASREGAEAMAVAMQLDFVAVSMEDFDDQRATLIAVNDILQGMLDKMMDLKMVEIETPSMQNADDKEVL
jgi:K+/H+ antiporter YhaU regulatory subunit KhtT